MPDIDTLTEADIPAAIALWQAAGLTRPWNDPEADARRALAAPAATIFAARIAGELVGTAMTGHDGHRGWSITSPSRPITSAMALLAD